MQQPMQLLQRWLRHLSIPVSKKFLQTQLLSHPDYPSLLSITDTLNALGVDNLALVVDKDKLHEIPVPFLSHIPSQGFILVEDVAKLLRQQPAFLESWKGIVVAAEKPEGYVGDLQNSKWYQEERKAKMLSWIGVITILGIITSALLVAFTWVSLVMVLSSLIGLSISGLIIMQELGVSNPVTEQLCSTGKQTDCNAVINSKGATLAGWLKWSDIGIIYFSAVSLLWLTGLYMLNGEAITYVSTIIAAASIPFTLFSIYYQWQIVKKWCTLCLITVALLWIQAAVLIPVLLRFDTGLPAWNIVALTAFMFIAIGAIWLLLLKPSLLNNKDQQEEIATLLKFKRNPDLFVALLEKQKQVEVAPLSDDLQIGNAEAAIQVVVACNPYCAPCARAHEALHQVAEVNGNNVGIIIRFACKPANQEDKKTLAVQYLLRYVKAQPAMDREERVKMVRDLLHQWYQILDLDKFSMKYPIHIQEDVTPWMEEQEAWCNKSNITHTPTIFINGYELVKPYSVKDLSIIIQCLQESPVEVDTPRQNEEVCS